ncbi:hypothetical protein Q5M85_04780 [Paraclostridium bifermentans]|nr:hypothetical protein [Paraclostridium bifermentans]
MGLSDDLNQEINFKIVKYYVDKNNENQIFSKDKKFKLVGIIKSQMLTMKTQVVMQVKMSTME